MGGGVAESVVEIVLETDLEEVEQVVVVVDDHVGLAQGCHALGEHYLDDALLVEVVDVLAVVDEVLEDAEGGGEVLEEEVVVEGEEVACAGQVLVAEDLVHDVDRVGGGVVALRVEGDFLRAHEVFVVAVRAEHWRVGHGEREYLLLLIIRK